MNDGDIAGLVLGLYGYADSPPVVWDHRDDGLDDGVCWALKRVDGFDVIVLRGSVTFDDWLADLRAIAVKTPIGVVHAGFYGGMQRVWSEVKPLLQQRVIVSGHSLGAARAAILCALMVADGLVPAARVVFGEPKPGFLSLAQVIANIPARSYRNGDDLHHDLVTDVPFSFPPLQYVHPTPVVPVTATPGPDVFSRLGVFAWHHADLYAKAIASLPTIPTI